ncbi:hypothetical protein GCM10008965_16660 [Methylorubrum aminovorans]
MLDHSPIRFSATLTPSATPTPAAPPPPPEAESDEMIAVISEDPVALTVRPPLPRVVIRLASTVAFTEPRMRFEAKAPPPETPTPAAPPPARLIAAAAAAAEMRPARVALTATPAAPVVRSRVSALTIFASTLPAMLLSASVKPTATETPADPPPDPARDAEPARASIAELSDARTVTLPASMPVAPSPSMTARVAIAIALMTVTPAADTPTPAEPPPPIEAAAAATWALMVCADVAPTVSAPPVLTLLPLRTASTTEVCSAAAVSTRSRPSPFEVQSPIRFAATETPMATPTPAEPPPAAATDAAATRAEMVELAAAVTVTLPLWLIVLEVTAARVTGRIELKASAPPPATATPAVPPPPMLTAAAAVSVSIAAPLRASTRTAPVPASMPSATLPMPALTAASMVLSASAKPIETATPFVPPKAALTAAETAAALIREVSAAFTETAPAWIALLPTALLATPLPSMKACVVTPMALTTVVAPPLTPTAFEPAPASPADRATMLALISFADAASTLSAPFALTPTRVRDASTTVPPFLSRA